MKRTLGVIVAGIAGASALLLLTGCGSSGTSSTDATGDVSVTACTIATLEVVDVDSGTDDMRQVPTATVEVTNSSGAQATYDITVEFTSKDGSTKFAAGEGVVTDVAAGQSKSGKVQSEDAATGEVTCTVTEVVRAG